MFRKKIQICKLDSASSIAPILRLQFNCFWVPSFQDLFAFRLVEKFSAGFFQTGSGVFPVAPSLRAFDATTYLSQMTLSRTGFVTNIC
jgi:hypothetical protein